MALTCIKRVCGILGIVVLSTAIVDVRAQGATDTDVLAAKEAAQRSNWRALDALRPRFAGHPLEAYPIYWLLAGTVDRADPAEVRAFLDRYPKGPLAESLRKEWLRALGAARSWETFRAEYPRLVGDDVEITCYSYQDRLERSDAEVAGEARALFLAGREAPAACDPVFAALAASGKIGEPEIWQRIRKLLFGGNAKDAKRANALLPASHRFDDKRLDRAAADPARILVHEKSPILSRAHRETVIYALNRLARANKPDEAAERLDLIAKRLGPDDTRAAWGQIAWQAALSHHPSALDWYARAGDTPLTDSQIAWKARAAMRAGDWKQVLAAIQALPPEESRESTWRYWRSRALRTLGDAPAADALLKVLAKEINFYGLLAAEETGAPPAVDWSGWRPQPADLDRVRALDGIQRALILYRVGLDNEAFREWIWAIRGLDDRGLLAAAELARAANIPDRAINTADRTIELHDFSLRYPTPHRDALAAAARRWDLDEALLYSLIRQESRFLPEARSRVGATGLMQLMPATARWVAKQMPVQAFRKEMLIQPEVNIRMGSYYFRRVLSDLGHPILAAAAYNAGPGRARRWRNDSDLEGAIYVETIPFNETRDYVKKVFANAWFYHHRLTGANANLRQLLGTVPGRSVDPAGAVAAIP